MIEPFEKISRPMALRAKVSRSNYEKCRAESDFEEWMYGTLLISLSSAVLAAAGYLILLFVMGIAFDIITLILIPFIFIGAALLAYNVRAYSVRSARDYRGSLIDANIVHAAGFMLTMAESNVPLKNMFENISNLGGVYGRDVALEAAYILSLVEEDGMDIVSALRQAQATSPSLSWQELLIGLAEVYGSGGSLKGYLRGKYEAYTERKRMDVRRFNDSMQGLSSVFLSLVGIASIFISLINLVFNMAGWLANDSIVWLDALIVVPLGSFIVIRMMKASNPEA
ncbi:MAG TPA: type II secretion system F family protein [Methanocella sp.]|uniref:type II secretion system F family protein n=1 Tax=Methanocella sp. TaxID=2052833 RepID=UPI002C1B914E|nr:type II secretion system F family protein [Methanocella sp.]HTY91153.1 type II secretion system F family protein [Methanocella sp.]